MVEAWKPMAGFEDWYEVSNTGRVKRIKAGPSTKTGQILSGSLTKKGYYRVRLSCNGERKRAFIHCLVLMTFIGMPEQGQECNHKNGIKTDNRIENLEWVTCGENNLHRCQVLGYRGELVGNAKLKNQEVFVIKQLLAVNRLTHKTIGKMFGVAKVTITAIKNGYNWAHI